MRKMCGLYFGNFNLILKLNFNKEVNKGKDQKLKFNLSEQQLGIALLADTKKLCGQNNLM